MWAPLFLKQANTICFFLYTDEIISMSSWSLSLSYQLWSHSIFLNTNLRWGNYLKMAGHGTIDTLIFFRLLVSLDDGEITYSSCPTTKTNTNKKHTLKKEKKKAQKQKNPQYTKHCKAIYRLKTPTLHKKQRTIRRKDLKTFSPWTGI